MKSNKPRALTLAELKRHPLPPVVDGLLARRTEPQSTLLWAVWLHGEAGRRLSKKIGSIGFLAREISGEVPALLARTHSFE